MIQLISIDLNGTLIHEHTMSDMIAKMLPQYRQNNSYIRMAEERRKDSPEELLAFSNESISTKVANAFHQQMRGEINLLDAFTIAGPFTQGISLGQSIDYVMKHVTPIDGFYEFMYGMETRGIPVILNSTGYRCTIVAIEALFDVKFSGYITNDLEFKLNNQTISNDALDRMIREYVDQCRRHGKVYNPIYDEIRASGKIDTGQAHKYGPDYRDLLGRERSGYETLETSKAQLLRDFVSENYPDIPLSQIAHVDDTMGGRQGIVRVGTTFGGLGIAFRPNKTLEDYILSYQAKRASRGLEPANIKIVHGKNKPTPADLRMLFEYLLD